MNKALLKLQLISILALSSVILSQAQDTTRIVSHNQVKVVTDPSKGENRYGSQVEFPKPGKPYRKVNLLVTFQCPDNLQCGEWDYIDYVNLLTKDPATGENVHYEIARLITPYGRFFGSTWAFTFKADITEFSSLLRNQATIEYVHSGYESNTTCGWKITVKFEFISGPSIAPALAVIPLWNGSFPYGDTTDDIENYLAAKKVRATEKTGLMRLRVIQTGHGMDEQDNCAEFCPKWREVRFDGNLAEHRNIWSECGTNPVYPQAGTWIYDRANWCPGCMVNPETFDFTVAPGSTHEFNIDMEPYKVFRGKPSANYVFSSFVVLCESPVAKNDAAIEEIQAPSIDENYSRMNPIGCQARIIIRNNGANPLKSLRIEYGLTGQKTLIYHWTGNLPFGKKEEVLLPGTLSPATQRSGFAAMVSLPNNKKDEYTGDNRMTSVMEAPPVYPGRFVLSLKTNRDTAQTAFKITGPSGKTFFERHALEMKPSTEYRDTISLPDGEYELLVTDTAGDGLEFWANPSGGMGQVKLMSTEGQLIKAFGSDFGSEIRHSFSVGSQRPLTAFQESMVLVYPHRPTQNTNLMLAFSKPQTVQGKLTTPDGKILQEMVWYEVTQGNYVIDLANYPDGIYMLEVSYADKTEKIRLKKAARR